MTRQNLDRIALWVAIPIGFTLPISTAADNILLYLALVFFILGGHFQQKLEMLRDNPVAMAALFLILGLLLGGIYGAGMWSEVQHYLRKYASLCAILFLIPLFQRQSSRDYALTGFMLAMGLTLFLSYVIATGWFAERGWFQGKPENAYVFKLYITQNVFMGFFAYMLALKAREAVSPKWRWTFGAIALLAAYNVLFMVGGRTGYVVLAFLLIYFCYSLLRWKGLVLGVFLSLTLIGIGYIGSDALRTRINLVQHEANVWQSGQGSTTSTGLRMNYWTNTLQIIREHPLLGVGTGGFEKAYAEKIQGTSMVPSNNPHNQYLLITAQLGIGGLLLLLFLFFQHWRYAAFLSSPFERDAARGVLLTIMAGSLVNSLLLDHAEGLFFAWMTGVLFAGLQRKPQSS